MIRVAVCGAGGRMGREVCRAVLAEDGFELVAAVDPAAAGRTVGEIVGKDCTVVLFGSVAECLRSAAPEVVVDFTHPSVVMGNVREVVAAGVHAVVGTTGLSEDNFEEIDRLAREADVGVFVAPNFALGAVLMIELSKRAARYMPHAEVIELHHDGKADAPSGTAKSTAASLSAARGTVPETNTSEDMAGARGADVDGIRVHSVRLPGLVAHQEVLFGAPGQTLSLRHDTTDRAAFMPGVMMAVKAVLSRPGLTRGLESILEV